MSFKVISKGALRSTSVFVSPKHFLFLSFPVTVHSSLVLGSFAIILGITFSFGCCARDNFSSLISLFILLFLFIFIILLFIYSLFLIIYFIPYFRYLWNLHDEPLTSYLLPVRVKNVHVTHGNPWDFFHVWMVWKAMYDDCWWNEDHHLHQWRLNEADGNNLFGELIHEN